METLQKNNSNNHNNNNNNNDDDDYNLRQEPIKFDGLLFAFFFFKLFRSVVISLAQLSYS